MKNVRPASSRRERRIVRVMRRLDRKSYPRTLAFIFLSFSGLVAFLTSYVLLHLGVTNMVVRYAVVVMSGYGTFLALLGCWIYTRRNSLFESMPDVEIDIPGDIVDWSSPPHKLSVMGGGGDSGGGGAGGTWETPTTSSPDAASSLASDGSGLDLDPGELGLVLLAIAAIIGGLLATAYVVYIAPVLFAELLVDGILIGTLYKSTKYIESRHWMMTAIKRTVLSAALTLLLFGAAGFLLQRAVPEARSIGEVFNGLGCGQAQDRTP